MQTLAELHKDRSHRDLKPQNIMVTHSRMTKGSKVQVKLIDFAGSRQHDEGVRYSALTPRSVTSGASACTRIRSCKYCVGCLCAQVIPSRPAKAQAWLAEPCLVCRPTFERQLHAIICCASAAHAFEEQDGTHDG